MQYEFFTLRIIFGILISLLFFAVKQNLACQLFSVLWQMYIYIMINYSTYSLHREQKERKVVTVYFCSPSLLLYILFLSLSLSHSLQRHIILKRITNNKNRRKNKTNFMFDSIYQCNVKIKKIKNHSNHH